MIHLNNRLNFQETMFHLRQNNQKNKQFIKNINIKIKKMINKKKKIYYYQ